MLISPSLLSADFANLERDIKLVEDAGADWLHIDVMDGHFVPNITIGVPVVASIKKVTKLPLDVHLMIENPEEFVEAFAKAGADIITFHHEAVQDADALIDKIRGFGVKAGISIKPKTPPEVLSGLSPDLILIMTVEPGFSGQEFRPECAQKILAVSAEIIQVDGGINAETAKICAELGANSLVAGNYIFKSDDIKEAIRRIR
jgi:ribulose-phosphate 3-epimerase